MGAARYELPRSRKLEGTRCLDLGTWRCDVPRCRHLGTRCLDLGSQGDGMPRSRNRGIGHQVPTSRKRMSG